MEPALLTIHEYHYVALGVGPHRKRRGVGFRARCGRARLIEIEVAANVLPDFPDVFLGVETGFLWFEYFQIHPTNMLLRWRPLPTLQTTIRVNSNVSLVQLAVEHWARSEL